MTGPTLPPVSAELLATVPVQHRMLIARWLYERAEAIEPSFVLSTAAAFAIKDVVAGAAVDLADPLAEDSTTEHAAMVIATVRYPARFDDPAPPQVDVQRYVPPDHFRATGCVDG